MKILIKEKTNWKYILIVMMSVLIAVGGFFVYLIYFEKEIISLRKFSEIKKTYKVIKTKQTIKKETTKFESQERFIRVIFPNGGERLVAGNTYWISWDVKNVEKIDILLVERMNKDSMYVDKQIIANDLVITGENKYKWNIPLDLPPSKYALLIRSSDGGNYIEDFSDDDFEISNTLSIIDKEKMLRQIFNRDVIIEGNKIVPYVPLDPYLNLYFYLDKIIEGSFTIIYEKEYLFIIQFKGDVNLTYSFLGVFDENKNLVTPSIDIDINTIDDLLSQTYLVGYDVNLNFYSCKGITYMLYSSYICPTGGVCSNGNISLIKVEDGKFKVVQNVAEIIFEIFKMKKYKNGLPLNVYGYQIKAEKDKILIYEWKLVDVNFKCIVPDCIGEGEFGTYPRNGKMMRLFFSEKLLWDNQSCRFIENKIF